MPSPPPAPEPAPAPSWQLRPLHMPHLPAYVEIGPDGLTVGREPDNDLILSGERFPGVSGHHLRLDIVDNHPVVQDLQSKNGTFMAERRLERDKLKHGDVITLGPNGPRFAIYGVGMQSGETLIIPKGANVSGRSIGPDTMEIVRKELGVDENRDVREMLSSQRSRTTRLVASVTVVALAAIGSAYWILSTQSEALVKRQEELAAQITTQLDGVAAQQNEYSQRQLAAFESRRQQLEDERETLKKQLEASAESATAAIEGLKQELARVNQSLDDFNPVNLEASKLTRVSTVERATVMVEVQQTLVNADGRELYLEVRSDGRPYPNFDGLGRRYVSESSGSGFVFTDEGWILTNAHVALKKDQTETLQIGEFEVQPVVTMNVVFSSNSARYPAELVDWAAVGRQDLALLKIEPFADMPHLPVIDLMMQDPERGSEVFLIGFPLGNRALQQGDTVIASTFRGIVSRRVGEFLQVDAAVHPGQSGGPAIDAEGRVIGVVVGMQATDDQGGASSAMGFIIPIADAKTVWPPSPDDAR